VTKSHGTLACMAALHGGCEVAHTSGYWASKDWYCWEWLVHLFVSLLVWLFCARLSFCNVGCDTRWQTLHVAGCVVVGTAAIWQQQYATYGTRLCMLLLMYLLCARLPFWTGYCIIWSTLMAVVPYGMLRWETCCTCPDELWWLCLG
jgi:hypothetical protein